MAEDKKDHVCKDCGKSFTNKGQLLAHYQHKTDCAAVTPEPEEPKLEKLDASIEKQVTSLGKAMAEKLRTYPQEKVMIPVDKLNKSDSFVVVGLNGFNIQIQRGKTVSLPRPVVDLLIQGGYAPTMVR